MPKSSIATRMPSALRSRSARNPVSPSAIAVLSVTSIVSERGSTPESRTQPSTDETRSGCVSSRALRFKDRCRWAVSRSRLPLGQVPAGLAHDPQPERHDQPGLLGDAQEPVRHDQPALRVLPAHQRLGANHLPRRQVHPGLVVEAQLALLERALQLLLDPHRAHRVARASRCRTARCALRRAPWRGTSRRRRPRSGAGRRRCRRPPPAPPRSRRSTAARHRRRAGAGAAAAGGGRRSTPPRALRRRSRRGP